MSYFRLDRVVKGAPLGRSRPAPPAPPDPDPGPEEPGDGTFSTTIGFRLPAGALGGTVSNDFLLPLSLTDARLRTTGNGGLSQQNGIDIRIEIAATDAVVPYTRDSYNASTGELTGWIRLPSGTGASGLSMNLKIGSAAVEDQQSAAGITWSGYFLSLKADGSDRAAGRDFTLGAGLSADSSRLDAFTLPGDATAAVADASWRSGSAICRMMLIKGDAAQLSSDIGWTDHGPVGGTTDRGAVARNRASGINGAADCCFFGEWFSSFAYAQGPGGSQITADWQHVCVNFVSGVAPTLYLGGVLAATTASQTPSGSIVPRSGGMQIGRGPFDLEDDGWTGSVGAFHERTYAYGEHEAAILHRMLNFDWNPLQLADSEGAFDDMPTLPDIDPEEPEEPEEPDSGTELPEAVRTVSVTNQSEFNAAYADATAGDHIVVQTSGLSIPNSNDWRKSGTESDPIVIKSDVLLDNTIGANFAINASDVILYGFDLPSRIVSVGNASMSRRVKLWRNSWRDLSGPSTSMGLRTWATEDIDVAYCEWTNWGGRAISFGIAAGTRRPVVRRCYFGPTPSAAYTNAHEALQIGFGYADRMINSGALIEECLFDGWNSDDEAVSVKTSYATLRRLRFINSEGRLGNRLGQFNIYDAILFAGAAGIRIHDKGCEVLGCDVTGASQGIRVATGDFETNSTMTTSSSPSTPYALDTYVGGCTGTLSIGAAYSGDTLDATNTTVRQHTGTVSLVSGNHTGTDSQPSTAATGKSWSALWYGTTSDVGPNGSAVSVADWFEQPFSYASAANRPIGEDATYAAATSSQSGYSGDNVFEEWADAGLGSISGANSNQFGVPFGCEGESDPARSITITSGSDAATLAVNIANDFPFYNNSVGYGEATNWLARDYTLYDIYNHMRSSDGATRTALLYRSCDVRELGHALSVADTKRYGSSASGCSTAIGIMRKSEIETPGLAMRHVLQLILPRGASGHSNPHGLSKYIQVPARYADATANEAAQNLGPIPYGGHVGIPPDDLSALQAAIDATASSAFSGSVFGNVSSYEAAAKEAMKRVATQCCHYGCIAIDGGAVPQFRADAPFSGYLAQAMMVIMRQSYWWSAFKLITNAVNGADYYITSTSGVYGGTSIGTLSTDTVGGGDALAPNNALDAP